MSRYEQIGEHALNVYEESQELLHTCEIERDLEPHKLEAMVRDNIRRMKDEITEMEKLI